VRNGWKKDLATNCSQQILQTMSNWYDFTANKETKREYLARVKYEQLVCKRVSGIKDIAGAKINKGVQYRVVTENSFNAIVIIDYLLESFELDEIIIAVYRMNFQAVKKIMGLSENIPISVLVSSFFRENKKYEKWVNQLFEFSKQQKNLTVSSAWSHAKVTLCRTTSNDHIVFEGSGNLSDNARIEQYLLENNKQSYEFHKNWILKTINDGERKERHDY